MGSRNFISFVDRTDRLTSTEHWLDIVLKSGKVYENDQSSSSTIYYAT